MQFNENGKIIPYKGEFIHVLSYNEKTGIQVIATTSENLHPDDKHSTISRKVPWNSLSVNCYRLQTGEAISLVRDKHSGKEYIEFINIQRNTKSELCLII